VDEEQRIRERKGQPVQHPHVQKMRQREPLHRHLAGKFSPEHPQPATLPPSAARLADHVSSEAKCGLDGVHSHHSTIEQEQC
jgi:hypothetical protein